MKNAKLKRILATTLAAGMIMASALSVCASGSDSGSGSDVGSTSSSSDESSESSNSGESSTSSSSTESAIVSANASVSVAGTKMRTSIGGTYSTKKLQGAIVTTPLADVKANLGLKAGQTPVITLYDTDTKKSYMAMNSIYAAATAIGGDYVTALNIDLSARNSSGKKVTLTDGSVGMTAGLPSTADVSKTYSIVLVQRGGAITIYEDQDTNPKTVTFPVVAGTGTYAIVAK